MHILIAALHRPTKPTGICRHAANLARCLADLSEVTKVTLITGVWQQHYFDTAFGLSSPKIQIVDVKIHNRSISRNIWFLFGLPNLVRQLNADLVHLAFPLPFLRSRMPCSVVATIHDLYPYECPENFGRVQSIFNRLFLKQCIHQSDGLACVSKETLKRLILFFPKLQAQKTIEVVYNYVDFDNLTPEIPFAFQNDPDTPFFLSVAQHRKNKNLDLIIRAYAHLTQGKYLKNSTKLILVGSSGPETENLHSIIDTLNLKDQVYFLSSLKDEELYWLYQHCDVYLTASSNEGFCLPLAEALSLSCKVVCSDLPIFREISSSYCFYFDLAKEPLSNLYKAILKALEQPSLHQANGHSIFSKTSIAKQYLDLYLKASQSS